ncbi:MAG TPA: glycosyltransferase [Thermomicrobiales bacterium]|nr:glycosyltransferase [Thermomicrobiales bacterium]
MSDESRAAARAAIVAERGANIGAERQPASAPDSPLVTRHSSLVTRRVAIVHDYLNQHGGAERVLEELHALWPDAPVFVSMYDRERMPPAYREWDIRPTFMQRLPGILRNHQPYLPVYPLAFARLDLRGYDLVLSSSSAFAKNVHPAPGALHVCYCHSPMRFAWNYGDYARRERLGPGAGAALRPLLRAVRLWDAAGAARVDAFIANSHTVAGRIARFYGREAAVIHPPVETATLAAARTGAPPDDFYLLVSRLVPYKRLDIVVAAFNRLGLPLRVVGEGRDRAALERLAGPTVRFLGRVSDEEKADLYARCRATLFPAEDDFGIAQVEAQAAGRPVIAYRAGGALETVVDGVTGLFFDAQSPEAVAGAVRRAADHDFDADAIAAHARSFDVAIFRRRMYDFVATVVATKRTQD